MTSADRFDVLAKPIFPLAILENLLQASIIIKSVGLITKCMQ